MISRTVLVSLFIYELVKAGEIQELHNIIVTAAKTALPHHMCHESIVRAFRSSIVSTISPCVGDGTVSMANLPAREDRMFLSNSTS